MRSFKNIKKYKSELKIVEVACIPHLEEEIKKFNTGEYNLVQNLPRI